METVNRYCIEIRVNATDTETSKVIVKREDIPPLCFYHDDMVYACYAFHIYESYCNNKDYYHCEFRPIYENYEGLICEKFSDMESHLYYDNYAEFKQFVETIGYNSFTKEFVNK